MRFPARLTLALARARLAHPWRRSRIAERFQFLDAREILHSASTHPVSHERLEGILAAGKPFVWIAGSEPLDYAGIAHLVRAVARPGRFVFLETSGVRLRRRIHEFPPLARIIFVVRLEARFEKSADSRDHSPSAFAIEGIRAAQLSGFWTVAHSRVSEVTEVAALPELATHPELEVDGWLISAANSSAIAQQKAAEVRRRIPHAQWRRFSEIVEHMLLNPPAQAPLRSIEPCESAAQIDSLVQEPLPLAAQTEAAHEGRPS